MFSLLLVVLTDCFVWFREAVNSRISTTRAENVTQYLLITRCVWSIINEDITKRSFCFLKISWHDSRAIFVKHVFGNDIDLFSIARTSEKSHVLSIWLMSVLNFLFGNIFCGRSITLAFLCRPWVNRREKRELSVAWAIRSSNTSTLLNFGSISRRSSLSSGRPRKKTEFPFR